MSSLLAPRFSSSDFHTNLQIDDRQLQLLNTWYEYNLLDLVCGYIPKNADWEDHLVEETANFHPFGILVELIAEYMTYLSRELKSGKSKMEDYTQRRAGEWKDTFFKLGMINMTTSEVMYIRDWYLDFLEGECKTFGQMISRQWALISQKNLPQFNKFSESSGLVVAEPDSAFDLASAAIARQYRLIVEEGFERLCEDFSLRYETSEAGELLVQIEKMRLNRLLVSESPPETGTVDLIGWSLPAERIGKIREAVAHILSGEVRQIYMNRSLNDLQINRTTTPPATEAESFLRYFNWLERGGFKRQVSQPTSTGSVYHARMALDWLGTKREQQLRALHAFLRLQEFMDPETSWQTFELHFSSTRFEPIRWLQPNTLLLYLFLELIEYRFFPLKYRNQLHRLLPGHFLDKHGEPFKPRSLLTLQGRGLLKPRKAGMVDDLIHQLGAAESS